MGFGAFLIWYFYNSISSPKDLLIDLKGRGLENTDVNIVKVYPTAGAYMLKGDSLLLLQTAGGAQVLNVETEAVYNMDVKAGDSVKGEAFKAGVYNIDVMRIIGNVFGNAAWGWIMLSLLSSLSSHILRALRWQMMLRPMGYQPKFYNTFFAVMIMYLANMAFPRLGEVMRCGVLRRYEKIPIEKSLGTMLTERMIDVLSLVIVGGLMLVTQYSLISGYMEREFSKGGSPNYLKYVLILLVLISAFVGFILFIRKSNSAIAVKLRSVYQGLIEGIKSIRNVQNPFLLLAYSAGIWVSYTLTIFFCLKAVPETSALGMNASVACLFFGSFAILAVQGGLGAYPLVVSKVLMLYGITESIGYAYGWLSWVAQTGLILLVGFISLILLSALNEKPETVNESD